MPMPQALQPLVGARRFWTDFFWETEPEDDADTGLEGCTVELPVTDGYGLTLSLDSSLAYFSLALTAPGRAPVEVAWDDQAHWHPHVLRWPELEMVCRAVAAQDPAWVHPGPLLLLLCRFAPICVGDDLDVIVPTLESAWAQVNGFSGAEVAALIERGDARGAGFRWRFEPAVGWCLEQDSAGEAMRGLYTLRTAANDEFPFAEWARLVGGAQDVLTRARGVGVDGTDAFVETGDPALVPRIARALRAQGRDRLAVALGDSPPPARACWVVETVCGLDAGTLLKRHVPRRHDPRETHDLILRLPIGVGERPLSAAAGKILGDTLDRLLRDQGVGRAESISSTSRQMPDGSSVTTEESLSVQIKGERDWGVRVIRDVLWWAHAPASVRLSRGWGEAVPLDLTGGDAGPGAGCLEISRVETVRWDLFGGKLRGHRFDRVPLDADGRRAVRAVLAEARADGPDEGGWFSVLGADGGALRVCLPRLSEDPGPGGGTVVMQVLSPEAARVLYDLMAAGRMLLLPAALAASRTDAQTVAAPWPAVQVVETAEALYDILQRGPAKWYHP